MKANPPDVNAESKEPPHFSLYVQLLCMALLWGFLFVTTKLGGNSMPIEIYNADRFIIGGVLLAFFAWRGGELKRVSWLDAIELTGLGLVGHGVMQMIFGAGIMATSTTSSALIYGCTPLLVALLSASLGLERLRLNQWGGIFLAILGVAGVVMARRDASWAGQTLKGDLLVMSAVIIIAIYTVWCRRILIRHNLLFVMAWMVLVGAVALTVWSWPFQRFDIYLNITMKGWMLLLYGAVFALLIPNLIFLKGVRVIGRSRASMFINAVPLLGCIAAWLVLDERMALIQMLGGTLIISGILLAQLNLKSVRKEQNPGAV